MIHLYSLTLQPPQHVINSTRGFFTGLNVENGWEEIVANLGTFLSLYQELNESTFKQVICQQMFCHVHSVSTITIPKEDNKIRDWIAVTADSGNITILEVNQNKFAQLVSLPFARTGLRRYEPGYFLSVSPCGRAIVASALEKYKLAWPLQISQENTPILNAPIEHKKSRSFIHACVALDVGYESPMFAFIERVFKSPKNEQEKLFDPNNTKKLLVLYEIDSNINSITRRDEFPIPASSNHLVALPGPLYNNPGGVVVCFQGAVQYYPKNGESTLLPLPVRKDSNEMSTIICSASFPNEMQWFVLLQNQFGDVFVMKNDENGNMEISYFDTVPIASSMLVLSQGILAVFAESGSNMFYYIQNIEGNAELEYEPSESLRNLEIMTQQPTMSRLTKMGVVPSQYGGLSGDIISIHGSGKRSSLKITRRGLPISDLNGANVITLGGQPMKINVLKIDPRDQYHSYILISTNDRTRLVHMHEEDEKFRVIEIDDSKFIMNVPTISAFHFSQISSYSSVQVHSTGIRIILSDEKIINWSRNSFDGFITQVAWNSSQMILVFSDYTVSYFEANDRSIPIEDSSIQLDIDGEIIAVAMPQPSEGIRLTKWLAVATNQMIVYIFLMRPENEEDQIKRWSITARQIVSDPISDLAFLQVPGVGQVLHIGHENGVITRSVLDSNSGELSSPQIRFLGHSPITFTKLFIKSTRCLLINAASPWLARGLQLTQLAAPKFTSIAQIYSPIYPDGGFTGLVGTDLTFFEIKDLNTTIDTKTFSLQSTPRQLVTIPNTPLVFLFTSQIEHGTWLSSSIVFNTETHEFSGFQSFEPGLSVVSASYISISNCVAVGFAKNLKFNPRSSNGGQIELLETNGRIIHSTKVEDIPGALGTFSSYILAGIGRTVRLYKIGQTQLLKKSESKTIPFFINYCSSHGLRIIIGDSAESFMFLKFDSGTDVITPFCDDCTPRFPLCGLLLDQSSIACGDRFGNFSLLRLPPGISEDAEIDPSGVGNSWEHRSMAGAPNKFDLAVQYHIGDIITSLCLSASGKCIIYGTVNGQIGAMIPVNEAVDAATMKKLESAIRKKIPNICGRDHVLYRSYYAPLKCVSDGDLLKSYMDAPDSIQKEIAAELSCSPFDISRMLTNIESYL